MKALKLIPLVLLVIILVSCNNGSPTLSIEGLWISTEESSAKFLHGTQKTVLRINKDHDGKYTARGVFLMNGTYQSELHSSVLCASLPLCDPLAHIQVKEDGHGK